MLRLQPTREKFTKLENSKKNLRSYTTNAAQWRSRHDYGTLLGICRAPRLSFLDQIWIIQWLDVMKDITDVLARETRQQISNTCY